MLKPQQRLASNLPDRCYPIHQNSSQLFGKMNEALCTLYRRLSIVLVPHELHNAVCGTIYTGGLLDLALQELSTIEV